MKIVKFISKDPLQKQFGHALRNNVNAYFEARGISTKGNSALYLKTIAMLSFYIVPFLIILFVPVGNSFALLLAILMGIGEAGIGMSVMHDAAHGVYSGKKWVNTLFASSMYMLGGSTFNWKIQHNILHHRFTNIFELDQDIGTRSVLRLCSHAPINKYQRYQYIYAFFLYGLFTLSKLVTEFAQLRAYNKSGITKEQRHEPNIETLKLVLSKALYLFIIIGLPILLTSFAWWKVLIGFAAIHVTAGIIMGTIFQMAHVVEGTGQPLPDSNNIIENEWMVHQLQTTSDFARNNLLLNWYIGGLNFQIEHHLFPNISHIHYRDIASIVEKTAQEYGFVYNLKPTFMDALISHAKRLKTLGRLSV